MFLQKLGHLLSVFAMAGNTQVESFKTDIEKESVHRTLDRAQVSHQLGSSLGNESLLAKSLGVGQSVVRLVGLCKSGELVGVFVPVKVAAVNDTSAHCESVTVHILCGRVDNDVGAPFKRTAVDRSGKSVVNDQRHAVAVGDTRKLLKIKHVTSRIRDSFGKEAFGVGAESLSYFLLRSVGIHHSAFDTEFFHRYQKEVVSASVDILAADKMVASLADVEYRIKACCLTRRSEHSCHAAFKVGDFGGHGVVGGILQTGVEISLGLQVKKVGHSGGVFIFESSTLKNRQHAGIAAFGLPARLYAYSLQ